MIKIKNLFFMLFLASFLSCSNVSAFFYELEFTDAGITSANSQTNPPSWYFGDADIISINESFYSTLMGSYPLSFSANFYSPFGNVFTSTSGSFSSFKNCSFNGIANKIISDNTLNHRIINNGGNASSLIYSKTQIRTESSKRFFFIEGNKTDSEGYIKNVYMMDGICSGIYASEVANKFNSQSYYLCNYNVFLGGFGSSGFIKRDNYLTNGFNCGGANGADYIYYLFNSSAGNVTYSYESGNPISVDWCLFYYPFNNPSSINSIGCSKSKTNTELSLMSNTLYVFALSSGTPALTYSTYWPHINLTIDLGIPDYECGEYSECINGIKQKTCIDKNGINSNRIETKSCSLVPLKEANLGFEKYETVSVAKCAPTWFIGCGWQNSNISVDRPEGWDEYNGVTWDALLPDNFHNDIMIMSNEWATEGTRSLKMWNIPMMEGIPIDFSNNCFNTSMGNFGVNRSISNNSLYIGFNLSFPSENFHISYDARACSDIPKHHDALKTIFDIELCPSGYYGNKEFYPTDNFRFDLVNSLDVSVFGQSFFLSPLDNIINDYNGSAPRLLTRTYEFDLNGLGINANEIYSLRFIPWKENLMDTKGNCIMLDNVKIVSTEESYESLLDGCDSKCLNGDYYEATLTASGSCAVVKHSKPYYCQSNTEIQNKILRLEPYCDGTTYYIFNSKTAKYETSLNNSVCITELNEENLYISNDILNFSSGLFVLILSPVFISFFIITIIMLIIQIKTNEWRLSVFVGFGLMLLLTIAGFFDALITFSLLALIILLASIKIAGTTMGRERGG